MSCQVFGPFSASIVPGTLATATTDENIAVGINEEPSAPKELTAENFYDNIKDVEEAEQSS